MDSPQLLTKEQQGRLTILKCRTPGEAFLVAQELEASDILVVLPEEEDLLNEYKNNGSVSVRVSTQSYEAAKELRSVIETEHWDLRAKEPLSIGMSIVAFVFGLIPMIGFLLALDVKKGYRKRRYTEKAASMNRWFWTGTVVLLLALFILSSSRR